MPMWNTGPVVCVKRFGSRLWELPSTEHSLQAARTGLGFQQEARGQHTQDWSLGYWRALSSD